MKDKLRHLTGNDYRGNYIAPGLGNARNNIVPQTLPHGGHGLPDSDQDDIGHLALRRAHLKVPPLPPFGLPVHLDSLPLPPPVAVQLKLTRFKGLLVEPDKPISYKQQIHFVGDTDAFINSRTYAKASVGWVNS